MITPKHPLSLIMALMLSALLPAAAWASHTQSLGASEAHHGSRSVPACDLCHGDQGQGEPRAGYPKLAGLDASYLQHQMLFYQRGERHNNVMQQYARLMNQDQIRAVAEYYSQLPAPHHVDISARRPSAQLLTQGSVEQGIPACFSCHGVQGGGNPDGIPSIVGQPPAYFIDQMNAWRTGQRIVEEGDPMQTIARSLTRDQLVDLAQLLK